MKLRPLAAAVFATLVMVFLSIINTAAAGNYPTLPANGSAALATNCLPVSGVVIQPPYSSSYLACSLGMFAGLPSGIGGVTFKQGDPNTLLVGTYEGTTAGVLYAIPLLRDTNNHVVGFSSIGAPFANAPYNNTGLAYGPGDVLFNSRDYVNELGEFKPGSTGPDRVIGLTALGVTPSISGINFVPPGFPHAGELKLVSNQSADWYAATVAPQSDGTYSIATLTKKTKITGYPEAFVYAPANSPQFTNYTKMLVGEYYNGSVSAYTLDSESNPVPSSRQSFMTGLPWVQGVAMDPITGDMIVATRGARVVAVRGFGSGGAVTPTHTPTTGPTPVPTYSITGRITTSAGYPLSGVTVSNGTNTTLTNDGGYYFFSGLIKGTYVMYPSKTGYTFNPSSVIVYVPQNPTQDFTGSPAHSSRYPPVILVHGYLGMPNAPVDKCEYGVDYWAQTTYPEFFSMPRWFADDGFDVWVAHWTSGPWPNYSSTVEEAAVCLAGEIEQVKKATGQSKVILVGHSQGGLVSRAYLQAYASRNDVQSVFTMGSAHGGVNALGFLQFPPTTPLSTLCLVHPGLCELGRPYMSLFNLRSEKNSASYYMIAGDDGGWMAGLMYPTEGPSDGVAGIATATGRYFSWLGLWNAVNHPSTAYRTHEAHINELGTSYFEPRPGQTWSQAYKCMREILLGMTRSDCTAVPKAPARSAQETMYSAVSPLQSGHIATGATLNRTLSLDTTGQSYFALSWLTGTLSLNLVNPNGVTIDPLYASANPSLVTVDSGPAGHGSPGWMTYAFTNTVPGTWTLRVNAHDAGPSGTDWTALATFASSRTLEVGLGTGPYRIGDTATFTATLKSGAGGLGGATIRLDLARSDNVTDTLTLTDLGGGNYQGTYKIPNTPGYMDAIFTATGSEGGTSFTRQSRNLISIMPQTGQLTAKYADRLVDENGDKKPEALTVDVGVNISKSGDYSLSADLRVGDQVVAQSSKLFSATAGSQTFTLRFDGSDVYTSKLNGPYTLTNLVLVDLQAAVPTAMGTNLHTTAPYHYDQFGPGNTLYLPMIVR